MFDFRWVDRTCTRANWRQLYRICRRTGDRGSINDESHLAERAELAAVIEKFTEDGRVGVVESGMDCDCVKYCHGRAVRGLTAILFQRDRDHTYEWADGPCYVSLCPPSELPESYSRDLVLEAFENGHPHIVYP